MKKKLLRFLSIILFIGLAASCSKNDSSNTEGAINDGSQGNDKPDGGKFIKFDFADGLEPNWNNLKAGDLVTLYFRTEIDFEQSVLFPYVHFEQHVDAGEELDHLVLGHFTLYQTPADLPSTLARVKYDKVQKDVLDDFLHNGSGEWPSKQVAYLKAEYRVSEYNLLTKLSFYVYLTDRGKVNVRAKSKVIKVEFTPK